MFTQTVNCMKHIIVKSSHLEFILQQNINTYIEIKLFCSSLFTITTRARMKPRADKIFIIIQAQNYQQTQVK
jgi:hypothetical protein